MKPDGELTLGRKIPQADRENRPIYLESSAPANNIYYAKFGFAVKKEIYLQRGPQPVRLSIMVREPVPLDSSEKTLAGTAKTVTASSPVSMKDPGGQQQPCCTSCSPCSSLSLSASTSNSSMTANSPSSSSSSLSSLGAAVDESAQVKEEEDVLIVEEIKDVRV